MKIIRNLLLAFFVVACLAYVNIIIPKPQQTEARTYNDKNGILAQVYNNCGPGQFKIAVNETPSCKDGSVADLSSYKTGVGMHFPSTGGNYEYKVDWTWASYYCTSPWDGNVGCLSNKQANSDTFYFGNTTDYNTAYSTDRQLPNMCGGFQNDFAFNAYYRQKGTTTWHGACSGGSQADPGTSNATWAHCSSGNNPTCPAPSHKTCQNNACVSVDGAGQDSCSTNTDCQPQTHKACVSNACSVVQGAGEDSCATDANCQPQTHKACQNHACTVVQGAGEDSCSQNSDCQTPHHNVCQNQACVRVEGEGSNSCRLYSDDCETPHHLACQNNACVMVPGAGEATCTTEPDSCQPPHLTVIKVVNNNHGGVKQAGDFVLKVDGNQVTNNVTYVQTIGDHTVTEDDMSGYHQVSNSCGDGHIHLNAGENRVCIIMNEDNGSNACTMPTCNTSISGCSYPYPDTKTCSCGPLVCITNTPSNPNITINVSQQQQQQQQQAVLGASVAPATTAKKLPATGSGAEVLLSLFGLLPIGLKLRKFV